MFGPPFRTCGQRAGEQGTPGVGSDLGLRVDNGLSTRVFKGSQGFTGGLQGVTRVCKGLQGCRVYLKNRNADFLVGSEQAGGKAVCGSYCYNLVGFLGDLQISRGWVLQV